MNNPIERITVRLNASSTDAKCFVCYVRRENTFSRYDLNHKGADRLYRLLGSKIVQIGLTRFYQVARVK